VAVFKDPRKRLPVRVKIVTREQWAEIKKKSQMGRNAKGKLSLGTAAAKKGLLFAVTNPDDSMSAVDLGVKFLHTIIQF
jgi:hypothetical protein